MKHPLLKIAVFLLIIAPALHAANMTSSGGTAPSQDVLVELAGDSETDRTWRWRTESGTSNHRDIMQTFTLGGTGTYSVDRFTLRVDTNSSPDPEGSGFAGATARIVIYSLASAIDTSPDAVLAQENFTVPSGANAGDYLTVTLAVPLSLNAGSTYGFGLLFDNAASNRFIEFATRIGTSGSNINASEYGGGVNLIRQTDQGGTFANDLVSWAPGSNQADQDLVFSVQGVTESPPPPAPEIEVTRGSPIADGGSDSVGSSQAGVPTSLSYTISNTGNADLTLSAAIISGATNCNVSVSQQATSPVASANHSVLIIAVTPVAAGAWSFGVSIGNNDSDENPYNWNVSGTASASPAPEIEVTRGSPIADGGNDSVGSSQAGMQTSLSYTISNTGNADLTLSDAIISSATNCTVAVSQQATSPVASANNSVLIIAVTPVATGAWSFGVSIGNNDSDENPHNWAVSGTAETGPLPPLEPAPPIEQEFSLSLIRKWQTDPKGILGESDGLSFHPDSNRFVGTDNGTIATLYDIANLATAVPTAIRSFKHDPNYVQGNVQAANGEVNPVSVTPDGRWMLTGINNLGVKVWNLATGAMMQQLDNGTSVDGTAFSNDGMFIGVGATSLFKIYAFDTNTGLANTTPVFTSNFVSGEVNAVDFSNDHQYAVAVGGVGSGLIRVFKKTNNVWSQYSEYINSGTSNVSVKSVKFSPDTSLVLYGARDKRARVLTREGALVKILTHASTHTFYSYDDDDSSAANEDVGWSADGRYAFTGGLTDGIVRIWRRSDWSLAGWFRGQDPGPDALANPPKGRAIEAVDVDACNRVAVSGDEGYTYIYQFTPQPEKTPFTPPDSSTPIVIEAENYDSHVPQGFITGTLNAQQWSPVSSNLAGGGVGLTVANAGMLRDTTYQSYDPTKDSPKLDFRVNFPAAGTYYIWARGFGPNDGNSVHVGLNGTQTTSGERLQFGASGSTNWTWARLNRASSNATITIPSAGVHIVNLWMCEDGVTIDRLLLTTNNSYDPSTLNGGIGPAETSRADAYAQWRTSINWGSTPSDQRDADDDPDGDGWDNNTERAFGTSPTSPQTGSGARIDMTPQQDGRTLFTASYTKGAADLFYQLEHSTDLTSDWSALDVSCEKYNPSLNEYSRTWHAATQMQSAFARIIAQP